MIMVKVMEDMMLHLHQSFNHCCSRSFGEADVLCTVCEVSGL